jgi:hypothetical protein
MKNCGVPAGRDAILIFNNSFWGVPARRDPEVLGLPPRDRDFALLRLRSALLRSGCAQFRKAQDFWEEKYVDGIIA